MPKIIQSPVKRWSGTITLSDPLNYPQYVAIQRAFKRVQPEMTQAESHLELLPALLGCIEAWNLNGGFPEKVTTDNFPASPRLSSAKMIAWLIEEISALVNEADESPNA